ncbi:hypothetical protein PM082_005753 [Marasmius tenuissimus]|nr:hypothetical protein PM082_005753 [Marasmius tenuissimus]
MADAQKPDSIPAGSSSSERFQRSNSSIPPHPLYNRKLTAVRQFRAMLRTPTESFDMDDALAAYDAVESEHGSSVLSAQELLTLLERSLPLAEKHYDSSTPLDVLHQWGTRFSRITTALEDRVVPHSRHNYRRLCMLSRAHALMGAYEEAIKIVESTKHLLIEPGDRWRTLRVFRSLVLAIHRYHGSTRVVDFVASHWFSLGSHLSRWSTLHYRGETGNQGRQLRKAVQQIASQIQNPVALLAGRVIAGASVDHRKILGEVLIESYCFNHLPLSGLDIHHELQRQGIQTMLNLQLSLVRSLVSEGIMGPAKLLFASIPMRSTFRFYLQTGLFVYGHDGDTVRAEDFYSRLMNQSWRNEGDIAMLMQAYATQGDSQKVEQLFNDFFPREHVGSRRMNDPQLFHYSVVIYSYARKGDVEGLNVWMDEISRQGLKPDAHVYTMLVQAFASRGDLDSISTVLTRMRSSGIPLDNVTYVNLISLLAHRRDPVGAEAMYKRAIREGISPTLQMVSALMNAHVEAGSWRGVIKVFDYIQFRPHPNLRLTIEVYNTVLKAYVVIGAPFRVVNKLFRKLEEAAKVTGVHPDAFTYALLIQSACDGGRLDYAREIFQEIEEKASIWESNVHVNVYIMTIMMAALLRRSDSKGAREIFDEMLRRGITPDATSYSVLVNCFVKGKSEIGVQMAEEYIKTIMPTTQQPWSTPRFAGRQRAVTALEHVYGPLLNGYSRLERGEDIERILQDMLDQGGEVTLGMQTTLMDAYRRMGNSEGVEACWNRIYQLGVEEMTQSLLGNFAPNDPTDNSIDRLRTNLLSVPLSIYLDGMSTAGKHVEVAEVWKTFQSKGLYFDSNNWNHLLVALLRAGEVYRAFQVAEKVIFPYQEHALAMHLERDTSPSSPLYFEEDSDSEEVMTVTSDTRNQLGTHRERMHRRNERRLDGLLQLEYNNDDFGKDFAEPLHALFQVSPAWNVWRIHPVGVRSLIWAFNSLRHGRIVTPVGTSPPDMDPTKEWDMAQELLAKITGECPRVCELVRTQSKRLLRRLGKNFYNMRFNTFGNRE